MSPAVVDMMISTFSASAKAQADTNDNSKATDFRTVALPFKD
jgi:hypothetical protein